MWALVEHAADPARGVRRACMRRMRRHKIEVLAVAAVAARGSRSADRLRERTLHRRGSARDGRLALLLPSLLAAPVPPHRARRAALGAPPRVAMLTVRRSGPREDVSFVSAGARPVLLATLDVPFAEEATVVRGGLGRRERAAARRRQRRGDPPHALEPRRLRLHRTRGSPARAAQSPRSSLIRSRFGSSDSASAARIRSTRSSSSSPSAIRACSSSGLIALTCGVGGTSARRDGSASGPVASCGRRPSRCPRTRACNAAPRP